VTVPVTRRCLDGRSLKRETFYLLVWKSSSKL
jgi:hypothetical protein